MIKINLIPKEIEAKAAKKKKGVLIAGAVIVFLAGVFGIYMFRVTELRGLRNRIAQVDRELRSLRPVVDKVRQIENQKNGLNRKITVIKDLMQVRLTAPVFMEDLAAAIPEGVWLSAISTVPGEGSLQLTLGVMARDNYAVADLLNALELSENFSEVQFTGLSSTTHGEEEVRTFSLRCRYHFKEASDGA